MTNPLAEDLDHILAHTEGLWEDLRGKRIFITGGTGFFGCWLLESFAWANDKLGLDASALVLTRNPAAFQRRAPHLASHPAVRFHPGDICDFEFAAGPFGYVIHAAIATEDVNAQDPLKAFDINVQGTRRTLEFARRAGAQSFLFTSSGAVYGRQPPELTHVPEDFRGAPDPLDTESAYGARGEEKRAAETLCALYGRQYGLPVKIARCFSFVGPYLPLNGKFAIGNFIRDGLSGGPIRVNGDGTPRRSYLYAADLMIWLWTILLRGVTCRPYNVGSDEPLTIAEVAQVVAQAFTPPSSVRIAQTPGIGRPAEHYVPDIRRAAAELNLRPITPLPRAIVRTTAFAAETGEGT